MATKEMLSVGELVERARRELGRLTGLPLGTTVRTARDERGWLVSVEMVEKRSVPDGMDILATYDVWMDEQGEVLEFGRKRLRKRVDTSEGER